MNINELLKLVQQQSDEWENKLLGIQRSELMAEGINYDDYLMITEQMAMIIKRLRNVENRLQGHWYESIKNDPTGIFAKLANRYYEIKYL